MKKILGILVSATLALGLFGCQGKTEDKNDQLNSKGSDTKQEITIGTSVISKDVLEVAQKVFNENSDKYKMNVKVFDDAITPNIAVDEGSIDANFYQYKDYLDNFNKDRGTKLKPYGKEIFAFQIGLYSEKIKDISEIKEGMTVAIANDATNRALALKLLNKAGIIKIKDGVEVPNVLDIAENKYNLKFIEVERLTLANALSDTDMAIAMADVIREAGKDSEKALAFDQEEGIVLVLKEEKDWAGEVEKALTSDEVKNFILKETKGTKTPLF
ncbi:NLPA family lipoprotein [Gottschalkia acidurici 9a]|uniref:NLPA family lipoprotein n=1 Tax=Gottschalkia acidurici (strain ATCC 7906 / DSM 604 / BCRC 14475 / CIP 104303 / KCTC 5404 / NCIMB 10678 / 9a) TaxID=1128398 RepID=K0AWD7_GOTA9|nr:MetQ/NlpA family ABC transporter substrate-binding protein [Gottschalkia acidurici]AFS78163.1 NLPA family lipoprotein [Gottschalkia acidurici 9a]